MFLDHGENILSKIKKKKVVKNYICILIYRLTNIVFK